MSRVCLVEDDPIMGEALVQRLTLEGFAVDWHRTGREGLRRLGGSDLAVIDVNLPDMSGVDLFESLVRGSSPIPPYRLHHGLRDHRGRGTGAQAWRGGLSDQAI